jgi:hypothetical protein
MHRDVIEKHLALTERHVEEGKRHVATQLLARFEVTLALHIQDRERLRLELAECKRPIRAVEPNRGPRTSRMAANSNLPPKLVTASLIAEASAQVGRIQQQLDELWKLHDKSGLSAE